jgi:hypothetical protein
MRMDERVAGREALLKEFVNVTDFAAQLQLALPYVKVSLCGEGLATLCEDARDAPFLRTIYGTESVIADFSQLVLPSRRRAVWAEWLTPRCKAHYGLVEPASGP